MEEDAKPSEAAKATVRTPPYVSFKTFQTLLEELQTNGIPPQIDRSVLSRFAGGLQGQLMSAMKSLDLMDDKNAPLPLLQEVVDSYGTERFKAVIGRMLRNTYSYVFALDLMNATPAMFAKAFSDATGAKEDVLRKCRTFFLHAAKEAEIPLGNRIQNAKFPRTRTARKKTDNGQRANGGNGTPPPPPPPSPPGPPASDVVTQLLGKFPEFDPEWPDEIKAKWFDGFDKFMSGIKGKGD